MKNWLERTPRTMGDWLALAAGTALLLAAAGQLPGLLRAAAGLLALLAPFGWGLVLAYVLDIPTRFFAAKLFGGRRGGALAVSYALLFGVLALLAALVGVTNIVPVLGPFLGAVPGIVILLLEAPWKAAEFAIIIFVVQQVDGNFIAPRILGGATGLPGLGVLLAIVVGGAWFGIPGMVLGVPTLAVLAALARQAVGAGLTARGLDADGAPVHEDPPPQ